MARRIAALFALALAAFFVAPAAAQAAPAGYGPTSQPGSVSSGTVTVGGTVVFSGGGFAAGATVTIRANGQVVGTVTADAQGHFSFTYHADQAGVVKLTATGAKAGGGTLTVHATVRVLAAKSNNAGATGHLPRTGSELGTQLWLAAGLLALGGGLVAVTVTRRRQLV